jgi:RNA polymerase sigma-70 factor (ECF subfamily)
VQAAEQERLLRLAVQLEELPDDQREAVERHHLRGERLDEAAAAMRRSAAAVAGLIKRRMRRLRERMQEND